MLDRNLSTAKKHLFKALSDETRLAILYALKENDKMYVTDICNAIGKEQSLISHHMACLRNCGLVNTEKDGKFVYYSIKNDLIVQILDLCDQHVETMFKDILKCEVVKDD
ncbi:MAG: ArsR/SmtB family transcription factor [Methanosarcinales archaeon]